MAQSRTKRPPTRDLQITGTDGVVYRIPAAALKQFAVPARAAWEVGAGVEGDARTEDLSLTSGPEKAIVSCRPLLLARLVNMAVANGFADEFQALVDRYDGPIGLPADAATKLSAFAGRGAASLDAPAAGATYVNSSLSTLFRVFRRAAESGSFTRASAVARTYDDEIAIPIPIPLSNRIKLLLWGKLQAGALRSPADRQLGATTCKKRGGGQGDGGPGDGGLPNDPFCAESKDSNYQGCPTG